MKVIANNSFVHGAYTLAKNEEADMPDAIARELANAGLVQFGREKSSIEHENKMAATTDNKASGNKAGKAK